MRPQMTAVRADRLGVEFRLNLDGGGGGLRLRRDGIRAFQDLVRRKRKREFWALRDVSFEIKQGEIFGILGGNGAGKSTLLKAMAGIIPPTEGAVECRGTVAPLIELGAAINPELTGAENIFLAGSLYRVPRKEIRAQFGKIVEFAGLRKFINSPVKNYSSGMFVRLAFSSIIFFQPDIVLIDEVFSVGDQVFQQKSFEKILGFKERGATIVIVSHDLQLLGQICERALVLSRGRAAFIGPVEEAIGRYYELVRRGEVLDADERTEEREKGKDGGTAAAEAIEHVESVDEAARLLNSGVAVRRWGNRKVEITGVTFVDAQGREKTAFAQGERFEARIAYRSHLGESDPGAAGEAGESRPVFGIAIATPYKMLISGPNTIDADWGDGFAKAEGGGPADGRGEFAETKASGRTERENGPGGEKKTSRPFPREGIVRFIVPELPLFGGEYLFSASVYNENLSVAYDHHELQYSFQVVGGRVRDFGLIKIKAEWLLE